MLIAVLRDGSAQYSKLQMPLQQDFHMKSTWRIGIYWETDSEKDWSNPSKKI